MSKFNFKCENPACQCEATMEDAEKQLGTQFACPQVCGAEYVLWKNPETRRIEAFNVIMPIQITNDGNKKDLSLEYDIEYETCAICGEVYDSYDDHECPYYCPECKTFTIEEKRRINSYIIFHCTKCNKEFGEEELEYQKYEE